MFVTLVVTVLLVACSPAATSEPQPTAAPVKINLTTQPETALVGDVELNFTVLVADGQPLSGVDVDVIADHTDMGGMTLHGKATEQGSGKYSIKANFSMAGNWEVTVQVRKDDLNYKQDIEFPVK